MTDHQHQSYATHRQIVKLFHGVLFGLLVLTLIGAAVNLYESLGSSERRYSASLILVLTVATIMVMFFSRVFALKAQDRAIRAEEQLRHYILTGKRLDQLSRADLLSVATREAVCGYCLFLWPRVTAHRPVW